MATRISHNANWDEVHKLHAYNYNVFITYMHNPEHADTQVARDSK